MRLLPALLLLTTCTPDVALLESGLSTAASVAHISALALEAAEPCQAFPCEEDLDIELGIVPLLGPADGVVAVTLRSSDVDNATLSFDATDIEVFGAQMAAVTATDLQARRDDEGVVFVDFSSDDIDVLGGGSLVDVDTADWTVRVDGVLTINGEQDSISVPAVEQFEAVDVVVDPECLANPVGGTGELLDVSSLIPQTWDVTFHPECDGRAVFTSGGSSLSVPLDFGG